MQAGVEASSTLSACAWGCTDTLAAAASVVMMTVDANAGVEVGQCGSCVASIAAAAALPGCEHLVEDKESNAGDAAPRYPEDAALNLSNAPLLRRKSLSAQHFTCADSTWCTALDGSDGQIHSEWPWMVADCESRLLVGPLQTGPALGPSADG